MRGIVAGDIIRRLVARTISLQLSRPVEVATAPFQYAMTTRLAQSASDPRCTIISEDGIGAFDLISRSAMLEAMRGLHGGQEALPFARLFYGQPSRHLWEDSCGVVHNIDQSEGGEQRDAMMPLLFSLGQHAGLVAVQAQLRDGERLFAFLDDVYVGRIHAILNAELYRHSGIRIDGEKPKCGGCASRRL